MRSNKNQSFSGKSSRNSSKKAFTDRNAGDQVTKRMTSGGSVLATGAGTVIPVTTITSSAVQSTPAAEWVSFAARYQQYRVRAIRVIGKATFPVNQAGVALSALYRADYIGSAVPGTNTQVLSDEQCKISATCHDFSDVVTWARNPNAKLWNPTSAAIPAANQFAWVCASPTLPALTTALTYFSLTIEYEVEFRGSQ